MVVAAYRRARRGCARLDTLIVLCFVALFVGLTGGVWIDELDRFHRDDLRKARAVVAHNLCADDRDRLQRAMLECIDEGELLVELLHVCNAELDGVRGHLERRR